MRSLSGPSSGTEKMRTIIVGIGNPILGDDGVGIHVLRELRGRGFHENIELEEAFTGGLNLVDIIVGYDRAILIDAVENSGDEPGSVYLMDALNMESSHSTNPHDTSFPEALELARKMGEKKLPSEIHLVGINIKAQYDFKDGLSENVSRAVPEAVDKVLELI
jgi:hydrogenase maturation protease